VGLTVFIIMVVINFVVITKGAGRIAEVSARFTLDAMPGKQMAIDADLNAGLISAEEARERRVEVATEADFYGSMDGASKFVRGDAIAGILILFINIIGGIAVGMLQHDMSLSGALHNYILLSIGDGLVAQIPALVLSAGTAILGTRVSARQDMAGAVLGQLFDNPKALAVTAGIMGFIGVIPGMPNVPFLLFAGLCAFGAWRMQQKRKQSALEPAAGPAQAQPAESQETRELSWDDVPPVDVIGLEVGYGLIPLVDRAQGGQLLTRIKGVRKKLSQDLGFLVQAVHIRDNLDLAPNQYRISIHGVPIAEAEVMPNREMAINPGSVAGTLQGVATKDPAFGLEAVWVEPAQRDYAQGMGYTVVDASTVVATHLSQIIHGHAHQLLGHEEVQKLLEILAQTQPKLVEELVPNTLPLSVVVKVLQNLLEERVPVRDTRTIVEALTEHGGRSRDPAQLTVSVREALGRMIVQSISGLSHELPVITLDPQLEQLLLDSVQGTADAAGFEPSLAERLQRSLAESAQRQEMAGQPAVLLTAPQLRGWLYRLARHAIPSLQVLSYNEVPDDKQIRIVGSVGQAQLVG
jgi:flagellar biosynthesis protein FlhA